MAWHSTNVQALKELRERQGVPVAELQHQTRKLIGIVFDRDPHNGHHRTHAYIPRALRRPSFGAAIQAEQEAITLRTSPRSGRTGG